MRTLALMMLSAVLMGGTGSAQETTGTITGVTTDSTGAVLPGVTVTLKNVNTGALRTVITNNTGIYTASGLPVGAYDVTFELQGFNPAAQPGVSLHVNDRLQVDGRLSVGGVAESVIVTASSTLQPIAALQTTMDTRQVQELPLNNRNFVQLATLAPGVSSDLADEVGLGLSSAVNMSINGARRSALNWLVDGVSNVDVGSNFTLLSTPSLESIEEFKVITNGYHAEWPRSGGGVVNVVTKSGSSRFAGSAYEFLRNDKLNANSFFRNLSTDPNVNSQPSQLKYHNFGATLGGPVIPNKMFFFFSEELRRITRAPASLTANVIDPAWLNDPANVNYVAPSQRDPNAAKLLALWPAPNVAGRPQFINSAANINNTRQEVARVDYAFNQRWHVTGRYSHDNSFTREATGLFLAIQVPNVATTDTNVPGHVASVVLRGILGASKINELQLQFSGNRISSRTPEGTRNRQSDYGTALTDVFPGNATGVIPFITVMGLSQVGANQLISIAYNNYTVTDNFTWQRGRHALKVGGLVTFEQKNENAANQTQGNFTFSAGGGRTAFQNFLTGNADGRCGNACGYSEALTDVTVHLRFNRYEMFAQDSWRPRSNVTVDYGVRYSLYAPVIDRNNVLTNFSPVSYSPAKAPACANPACTTINLGTGDPLNGIVIAGKNSPYGRAIYRFDKSNVQPRIGVTWDPAANGRTIYRSSYGVYFDQALVGIFEQNAFANPPYASTVNILNARLSNPGAGTTATSSGVLNLVGNGDDFRTPRTQQWNVGLQREIYSRGAIDVTYVGTHGDRLIRPIDINYPQPADVLRLGSVNLARPYKGYGSITLRETTARSNYWGILSSFRHDSRAAGSLTLNYTLSRNRTDATNDRETVDIPQNPLDLAVEYADARTDRRHIFTASYVYMLPFDELANPAAKAILGGWSVSGITTINSGQPVSRISANTNGFLRGGRPNIVGDPAAGQQTVNLFWFNPNAYAPAADGTFGNSVRAEWRQPGRNQTDLSIAKNWSFNGTRRVQFRADMINAFNHTQWQTDPQATGLDVTCTSSLTTCNAAGDTFGQILNARAPREIQLGLKFYW
jgi:hypothetical protein